MDGLNVVYGRKGFCGREEGKTRRWCGRWEMREVKKEEQERWEAEGGNQEGENKVEVRIGASRRRERRN